MGTLSSGNADGDGNAETREKTKEGTPLWWKFTNILSSIVGTAVSALPSFLKLLIFVPGFKSGWLHSQKYGNQLLISNDECVWNGNELLLFYHVAGLIISTYVVISFLIFTSMIWKSTSACPNFASPNAACPLSLRWSKLTYQQILIRLARHNQCTDW